MGVSEFKSAFCNTYAIVSKLKSPKTKSVTIIIGKLSGEVREKLKNFSETTRMMRVMRIKKLRGALETRPALQQKGLSVFRRAPSLLGIYLTSSPSLRFFNHRS